MTAADPTFIDTNILVNANVASAPFHVLREYLATLSRPQWFASPQPPSVLIAQIQSFELEFLAEDSQAVTATLLQLIGRIPVGGRQIHDANIVATMQVHSIQNLLTYNVADFKRFAPIITITSP